MSSIAMPAARVGDQIAHTMARFGMIAGFLLGAALVAATVATGGAALIVVAGAVAAGAAGGALAGGKIGAMYMGPPTGALVIGSPNILINYRPATMTFASLAACSHHSGAPVPVATGSESVFFNDGYAAREGETMECSSIIIADCSPDVIIGGASIQDPRVQINPEIPKWVTDTLTVVMYAGMAIATGGAFAAAMAGGATVGGAALTVGGTVARGIIGSKVAGAAGGEIGYALDGDRGRAAGQIAGEEIGLPGRPKGSAGTPARGAATPGRPPTAGAPPRSASTPGRSSTPAGPPPVSRGAPSTPSRPRSTMPGPGNRAPGRYGIPDTTMPRTGPRNTAPSTPAPRKPITDPARLLEPPGGLTRPVTPAPSRPATPPRPTTPPRNTAPSTPAPRKPITDPARLLEPPGGLTRPKAVPNTTPTRSGFTGKLKGEDVTLPGVGTQKLKYTKRPAADTAALRRKFNSSGRKNFVKGLVDSPAKMKAMRQRGFKPSEIANMRKGKMPNRDYQVHHKRPLDDGGTNDPKNLVLIKNDPYHKVITNAQSSLTKGMEPGDTRVIDFPIPSGSIYP